MDIMYTDDNSLLEFLTTEQAQSPETLLIDIEDRLDRGDIDIDEAILLLNDCHFN